MSRTRVPDTTLPLPAPTAATRARWTPQRTDLALRHLCARLDPDRDPFPGRAAFEDAGLAGLYVRLQKDHALDHRAAELGFRRRAVGRPVTWDEPSIQATLRYLCHGHTVFPGRRAFERAGVGSLYVLLDRQGALDDWARRLNLPRRTRRAPARPRTRG